MRPSAAPSPARLLFSRTRRDVGIGASRASAVADLGKGKKSEMHVRRVRTPKPPRARRLGVVIFDDLVKRMMSNRDISRIRRQLKSGHFHRILQITGPTAKGILDVVLTGVTH